MFTYRCIASAKNHYILYHLPIFSPSFSYFFFFFALSPPYVDILAVAFTFHSFRIKRKIGDTRAHNTHTHNTAFTEMNWLANGKRLGQSIAGNIYLIFHFIHQFSACLNECVFLFALCLFLCVCICMYVCVCIGRVFVWFCCCCCLFLLIIIILLQFFFIYLFCCCCSSFRFRSLRINGDYFSTTTSYH